MNMLSKSELITVLEIISDCTRCETTQTFFEITSKVSNLLQADRLVFLSSRNGFPSVPASVKEINISYPTDWTDTYRAQNFLAIDPIILSGKTGLLYWKDVYREIPPDREFYSQAKSYGLANGFSHIISNQQIFGLMSVAGKELVNSPRNQAILNNLAPHLHQLVLSLTHQKEKANLPRLTPREREVLLWAMEGKSNWEISVVLGIGRESVKGHIANILRKLNASNRTHAVAIALQNDLLFPAGILTKSYMS
ncbi:MAG TPA: LuxR family transcriptional regulator [Gammaproteobacteria bacterium]|nr:LuxR family transcriptional regulator [Gammaproteobacteria bacterium]